VGNAGAGMSESVSILIPCFNAERWIGQAIEGTLPFGQAGPRAKVFSFVANMRCCEFLLAAAFTLCGEGLESEIKFDRRRCHEDERDGYVHRGTVLAVAVGPLAIPTSHAQRAAGISRVGWLEVCGQGP
jgi:hypothetical protein